MPDISTNILNKIKANRLHDLGLPAGVVIPDYGETSIRAIPATVSEILKAPTFPAPTLDPEILARQVGQIQRVIVILVDALSYTRLQRWLDENPALVWNQLARDGVLAPLTSVSPSTTSTCLPTLWSGQTPAEHGFVGYELWLKEFGVVANMIKHTPFNVDRPAGTLEQAGFEPETALEGPNLGTHLNSAGIDVHTYQHYSIAGSGLSRVFLKDTHNHGFSSTTDLWFTLNQSIEAGMGKPSFHWVYWGDIDHFSHLHGPDSDRCRSAFKNFSRGFDEEFLAKLPPDARKDTLVILTADHGQIHTRKDPFYDLQSHQSLERRLHMLPTGENRVIYFYIRPGQTGAVREYMEKTFRNQFVLIDPDTAIQAGFFGPGKPHPRLRERVGDLIAIAQNDAYLWWSRSDNPLLGRHGGLSELEMLVPFLAARI